MANEGVRLEAKIDGLRKAASTILNWIDKYVRSKVFSIELPKSVQTMIRCVIGRDFDSHNITANGISYALNN